MCEAQTFSLPDGGALVKMRSIACMSECPFISSGRSCRAALNDGSSPRMSSMVGVTSTRDASQIVASASLPSCPPRTNMIGTSESEALRCP